MVLRIDVLTLLAQLTDCFDTLSGAVCPRILNPGGRQ